MNRQLDKAALIISALSSPFIVIAVFSLVIIGRYSPNLSDFYLRGLTFVLLSVFLPFLFIILMVGQGKISDLHISIREQRIEPFVISIISTLLLFIAFLLQGVPHELMILTEILLLNGIIFLAITKYWKASIHAATFSGSTTLAVVMISPKLAYLFLLIPLVAWARIRRHRHNVWQTILASIISLIIALGVFKIEGLI